MKLLMIALFAVGLMGCRPTVSAVPDIDIDQVRADLETIANARIFFGHQSVGRDLLAAIETLSKEAGVVLPIVPLTAGAAHQGKGLFHANVGRNREPDLKLAEFVAAAGSPDKPFDMALLKFCYLDLGEDSKEKSPENLFERYKRDMSRLQAEQPKLTLLHTTMPLMSDPPGWKTSVKRWVGWPTWRDDAHQRRAAYNQRIREGFGSAKIFDIARLESTGAGGEQSSFTLDGKIIETMALENTPDGGHLNELANRRIAAALLHSMADILRQPKAE